MITKSLGMVSMGHVSLDGSKFCANTSKHKASSYKRLKEQEAKLTKEIDVYLKMQKYVIMLKIKFITTVKVTAFRKILKLKKKDLVFPR